MHSVRTFIARFALFALLGAIALATLAPAAAAATPKTEYEKVYATARAQLGDRWEYRARGPNSFDCSGLVWYAFHENGLWDRIGGYKSVGGYYSWFKSQGKVSRSNPKLGDLIVWGDNQHIGIYIGDGKAISTLTTKHGVSIHPIYGYLGIRFKAFLHVDITRP